MIRSRISPSSPPESTQEGGRGFSAWAAAPSCPSGPDGAPRSARGTSAVAVGVRGALVLAFVLGAGDDEALIEVDLDALAGGLLDFHRVHARLFGVVLGLDHGARVLRQRRGLGLLLELAGQRLLGLLAALCRGLLLL